MRSGAEWTGSKRGFYVEFGRMMRRSPSCSGRIRLSGLDFWSIYYGPHSYTADAFSGRFSPGYTLRAICLDWAAKE